MLGLLFLILLAVVVFYVIISSDMSPILKFLLVVGEMFAVGEIMIRRWKLSGEYGLILLKSKKGMELIERLSKKKEFWNFFADTGAIICYGVLSFFIMRKHVTAKSAFAGFVILAFIFVMVAPVVLPFLGSILGMDIMHKTPINSTDSQGILVYVPVILVILGGLFAALLAGLLSYGYVILTKVINLIMGVPIEQTSPGVTLLLPGINLPFFEGIVALIVILVVHEGAHAILARIAKVPLLSSGVVLFGIIPVGAFVEPDEKQLKKVESTKQTRVIVAGSTSNFITCAVFFIIFIGFNLVADDYRETGFLVVEGMESGTIIYEVDGVSVDSEYSFEIAPDTDVVLLTNKGEVIKHSNEEGLIGIRYYPIGDSFVFTRFSEGWMNFIYMALGLTFALNFAIGAVNLLPLPLFDGYRTLEINIKNKLVIKGLMYVTLLAFIMNFVPWLFA